MKILHIANDFCKTKVHSNLVRSLDELGVCQVVFNAVRSEEFIGRNAFEAKNTDFLYSNIVKPYHKYFYHLKQKCVYDEILQSVKIESIDLCHASTLFTDGGLAYRLYKKYGIPYFVAIRNTDVNQFMKRLPNTWIDGIKILLNSEKIFFISEGLRKKFEEHIIVRGILSKIKDKFILMPNGIDDFFLDHVNRSRREGNNIVYVGSFVENKNVTRLALAVLRLRDNPRFKDITLTLVGGGKEPNNVLPNLLRDHPDVLKYVGPIYDKSELCEVFRNSRMFAMPSIYETFGLVYVEALSQNLPILYTKNQGVDGLFGPEVGESVNPLSVDEIVEGLKKILTGSGYSNQNINFEEFRWSRVAAKYKELYKATLGCKDVDQNLLKGYLLPD